MEQPHVLLVEDNESDIRLTLEALKTSKLTVNMQVVKNGEEALQYLRREGAFKEAQNVNVVLLDLNIPKINGLEVLAQIKADSKLKLVPVIILTSSQSETDIVKSYAQGAAAFCTKPISFQTFEELVRKFSEFWFAFVKFPSI